MKYQYTILSINIKTKAVSLNNYVESEVHRTNKNTNIKIIYQFILNKS